MANANEERPENVRAPFFYLAHSAIQCPRCMEPTSVYAIVLPRGHEVRRDSGDSPSAAAGTVAWAQVPHPAMLFYVEGIPGSAQEWLATIAPSYRKQYSKSTGNSCWTSACEHCGYLMDDEYLHGEPGGAFMPPIEGPAQHIAYVEIPVMFSASAAGYTDDIAFMRAIGAPGGG